MANSGLRQRKAETAPLQSKVAENKKSEKVGMPTGY